MTALTVLKLITVVLAVAKILVSLAERNKWMAAGAAAATLKGLQDADAAINSANQARADMHDTNTRDPASVLRDDDGFKRPD
jgi:hypothetical protein